MLTTKQLIHEAVSLPVEERAVLVDSLLRSLNTPEDNIDREWITIVKRRLAELRSGMVIPIPGDEVFAKIWKRFGV
ncbi:addiction module protein [Anaerolineales bacterium HSG24]|nr:addiction module protein [Anaerolineales bacterium HSG24]